MPPSRKCTSLRAGDIANIGYQAAQPRGPAEASYGCDLRESGVNRSPSIAVSLAGAPWLVRLSSTSTKETP